MISAIVIAAAIPAADVRPLLTAIRQVESGGDASKVGDNGRSRGPYQIQVSYWRDSRTPGRYAQVHDRAYAERVVRSYWARYCPRALAAGNYQTLARVHNGGPAGAARSSTLPYWHKVRKELCRR